MFKIMIGNKYIARIEHNKRLGTDFVTDSYLSKKKLFQDISKIIESTHTYTMRKITIVVYGNKRKTKKEIKKCLN